MKIQISAKLQIRVKIQNTNLHNTSVQRTMLKNYSYARVVLSPAIAGFGFS